VYDWSGNELWKKEHKQAKFAERVIFDAPTMNVNQKRELLKGKKRYAKGQYDLYEHEIGAGDIVVHGPNEIDILEITEE